MQGDKPVVGITKEEKRVELVPLSLMHTTVSPAVSGVTVTLSCEV